MLQNSIDSQTLGYLGRALSLELSAVQLYSTQARLVDVWGLAEMSKLLSEEAKEEMQHAERIISRMLAVGYAPNASQLRPVKLGQNVVELLQYDYEFETELVGLYTEAVNHCIARGDNDNRMFFEGLLGEEINHQKTLEEMIRNHKK